MIDNDACEPFQEILDRLFEDNATTEDTARLEDHAVTCADCAMLLEVHRHLAAASLQELEAAVPDRLVEEMWPQVERATRSESRTARPSPSLKGRRHSVVWRWVAAAQAAAIVLLAAGVFYLFDQLRTIERREADLAGQVAELDWRTSTARRAGVEYRRESKSGGLSVAAVTRYLRRLPEDTPVLAARDARRLMSQLPEAGPAARPDDLHDINIRDGLMAGEALKLIAALDLDPSMTLPARQLRAMSRRYD